VNTFYTLNLWNNFPNFLNIFENPTLVLTVPFSHSPNKKRNKPLACFFFCWGNEKYILYLPVCCLAPSALLPLTGVILCEVAGRTMTPQNLSYPNTFIGYLLFLLSKLLNDRFPITAPGNDNDAGNDVAVAMHPCVHASMPLFFIFSIITNFKFSNQTTNK
jgi:hypothetical protein